VGRFLERTWPYILAVSVVILWFVVGYNMADSQGYNNALDSTSNMCAILLGFVAAMFPVVLSLRRQGNYVDKVVEYGGDLLKSYYVETIISGVFLIMIVTVSYFRIDARVQIKDALFYAWLFCVTTFLSCSIRCTYFLFRFMLPKEEHRIPEEGESERKFKEEARKKDQDV
jgi:hypothetical protein